MICENAHSIDETVVKTALTKMPLGKEVVVFVDAGGSPGRPYQARQEVTL
jgi:hypothetical protein